MRNSLITVMNALFYVIMALVGLAVGALTGITGGSGVIVVVPFLLYTGLDFPSSVGSSLLVDLITSSVVVYQYFRHGNVNWRFAITMGAGAVIGAWAGARISVSLPQRLLIYGFFAFSFIMAAEFLMRAVKNVMVRINRLRIRERYAYIIAMTASLGVGLITGTLGASGGMMFFMLSMLLFSADVRLMIGTATLSMMLSATSGAASYALLGRIDIADSTIIGLVSLISGFLFASYAHRLSQRAINAFLSVVFLLMGTVTLMKVI